MNLKRLVWIPIFVVLFALVILAVFLVARGTLFARGQQTPAVAETPTLDRAAQQIETLTALLNSSQVDEEGKKSVRMKLDMAIRMATQEASLRPKSGQGPLPKDATPTPSAVVAQAVISTPEIAQGIFEGSQGLVKPSTATIANMWQGWLNGTGYQVFAGSQPDQPEAGLVIVVTLDPGSPTGSAVKYPAPEGVDSLRILNVNGPAISLQSKSGARLTFDLSTKTYTK